MTCQLAGRMGDRPGLYGRDIPGSAEALPWGNPVGEGLSAPVAGGTCVDDLFAGYRVT